MSRLETMARFADLMNGQIKKRSPNGTFAATHGKFGTPIYKTWVGMIQRCENPNSTGYKYYGARGITVCGRWHTFENFFSDMGEKPRGLTLERKDFNGPYSLKNCKWADWTEQNRNRRTSVKLTFNRETLPLVEWARRIDMNYPAMCRRLGKLGWSVKRALTERKHFRRSKE